VASSEEGACRLVGLAVMGSLLVCGLAGCRQSSLSLEAVYAGCVVRRLGRVA